MEPQAPPISLDLETYNALAENAKGFGVSIENYIGHLVAPQIKRRDEPKVSLLSLIGKGQGLPGAYTSMEEMMADIRAGREGRS